MMVVVFDHNGENLKPIVDLKQVLVQEKIFPSRPDTKFYRICNKCVSTYIKMGPIVVTCLDVQGSVCEFL